MKELAKKIDLTLLRADATEEEIKKLCRDARKHNFRGVCVNLYWALFCARELRDSGVKVVSVIDFPLGAGGKEAKAYQAKVARGFGASEIDSVINIGAFKEGDYRTVSTELDLLSHLFPQTTKVITEIGYWDIEQTLKMAELLKKAKILYFKTSSGFEPKTDIKYKTRYIEAIKKNFPDLTIKAAEGVRALKDVKVLLSAGADILGISAPYAQKIVKEAKRK